jgi:hypothetical protein
VRGEVRQGATVNGLALPFNVVPDSFIDKRGRTRSNIRFQGWVDLMRKSVPSDSGPVIEIECTDNTRMLLEENAPPRLTVDPTIRIDQAIANYLASFPQFRGLGVQYRPAVPEDKIPRLGDALTRGAYPPKLGPTPTANTGKLMVWDYLTDVVEAVGHTVRMDGTTIVIQQARTLYAQGFTSRPDDTFTGRILTDGTLLRNRTYEYGDNIKEFELERHFTRRAPANIEVRSMLPKRKKTQVVRYPPTPILAKPTQRQKRLRTGNNADQSYHEILLQPGIEDTKILLLIAQGIYETWGRNEVQVTVVSKNLASKGGEEIDPDALEVQPGDAIDITSRAPGENEDINTVQVIASESVQAQSMVALGLPEAFAEAYARAYANIGFPKTFRSKTASSDWDNEKGVNIEIQCINYIEVRVDAELPPGQQITPEESATAPQPEVVQVQDPGAQ